MEQFLFLHTSILDFWDVFFSSAMQFFLSQAFRRNLGVYVPSRRSPLIWKNSMLLSRLLDFIFRCDGSDKEKKKKP